MKGQALLVETGLVSSIVRELTWAYVRIGEKHIRKRAKDLQEGDLVVIDNESIDRTLEDIIPTLEKSTRYQVARQDLFEKNGAGLWIPKLRTLLLRGLTDSSMPRLEERILKDGGLDFELGDYRAFQSRIVDTSVDVSEDQTREWLKGGTIAPRNWGNFSKLVTINPEFQVIFDSQDEPTGFHHSYMIYTGIHRTIMQYIAIRTGDSSGASRSSARMPNFGVYSDEIELVVKQFLQEVDDTRSASRVTNIRRLSRHERERAEGKGTRPDPRLKKGICTAEIEELELADVNQVRDEYRLLKLALYDIINKYCFKRQQNRRPKSVGARAIAEIVSAPYTCNMLLAHNMSERRTYESDLEEITRGYLSRQSDKQKSIKQIVLDAEILHDEFMRDLGLGVVDEISGLAPNTTAMLVDVINQYGSALPASYFNADAMKLRLYTERGKSKRPEFKSGRPRRDLQRQIDRLERRLEACNLELNRTYGLEPGIAKRLFLEYHRDRLMAEGKISSALGDVSPVFRGVLTKKYVGEGILFYTEDEAREVFRRNGVEEAMNAFVDDAFN
ncbi:hypothetical protein HN419_07675 [Candidatus Woesearchaeota archaeon]|jgi:hypothetical protein|nr:hypothetical protein [Candidatus Woesearchaeota archaeon]MBT3538370.1 hypothetical protein [Candidatus Woesearchaeota archaeon]MBT4698347.1 hypothetical protein [Candidatus Woesearchaeota archaeon]MBT4717168.1 hypothetical protein [Candidatus Woesearchaeota archaeon]MBT7106039.1 hypothetical protein [Candidatus Woesearchaeota archaeon]